MVRFYISFLLVLITQWCFAQHRIVVKDLSSEFRLFEADRYISVDSTDQKKNTLYFVIDGHKHRGQRIEMVSKLPFTLFINGQIAGKLPVGENLLSIDSLATIYSSELSFAIHGSRTPVGFYTARIVADIPAASGEELLSERDRNHFHDFAILCCGVLLLCFVLLYRTNPQLLFDYINFIKLFSAQEREENMLSSKMVASNNLLFYGVASMLFSFLLLVMNFYSQSTWVWLQAEAHQSVGRLLFSWVSISLLIFLLLMTKSLLVFSFSRLFDFNEAPTIQFFNFIRLVFMICLITGLMLLVYFVFGVTKTQAYVRLFYIMSFVFVFWLPLVFLKLLKRSPYSMFHLFSYLCAVEIFPIVIVVKFLFL